MSDVEILIGLRCALANVVQIGEADPMLEHEADAVSRELAEAIAAFAAAAGVLQAAS